LRRKDFYGEWYRMPACLIYQMHACLMYQFLIWHQNESQTRCSNLEENALNFNWN
jgi:hypothetical protein